MTPADIRSALALRSADTTLMPDWLAAGRKVDAALPLLLELWEAATYHDVRESMVRAGVVLAKLEKL